MFTLLTYWTSNITAHSNINIFFCENSSLGLLVIGNWCSTLRHSVPSRKS